MSAPISAMRSWAVVTENPGMVHSRAILSSQGRHSSPIWAVTSAMSAASWSMRRSMALRTHPDPFLAGRGWHMNKHGMYTRRAQPEPKAPQERELEAGL